LGTHKSNESLAHLSSFYLNSLVKRTFWDIHASTKSNNPFSNGLKSHHKRNISPSFSPPSLPFFSLQPLAPFPAPSFHSPALASPTS